MFTAGISLGFMAGFFTAVALYVLITLVYVLCSKKCPWHEDCELDEK